MTSDRCATGQRSRVVRTAHQHSRRELVLGRVFLFFIFVFPKGKILVPDFDLRSRVLAMYVCGGMYQN